MKLPRSEMKKARIEIIPMIDTIFFLLVFFMITSLSMVRMKAMTVAIPRGASAETVAAHPQPTVILTLTNTGEYYVNTSRITSDSLSSALQARVNASPKSVIVLNFAKSQTTQNLIRVMDVVNRLRAPDGSSVQALMATEPVDKYGRALSTAPASSGGKS